jgi:ABC-2 type transport system permease protein
MRVQRLIGVTVKELRQLSRDRKLYPLLFIAPIFQLIVLGYAATFDIRQITTAVYDADRSALGRKLLRSFHHNGYFNLKYHTPSRKEIFRLIDGGKAKVGIEIPVDFQRNMREGKPSPVHLIVDGTESNSATIAMSYATVIAQRFSAQVVREQIDVAAFQAEDFLGSWRRAVGRAFLIENELRIWYNPDLRSAIFMVPGVICMILLIVTTNLTALSIVKEKEIGTMEQLMVTPLKGSELIVGKLLPYIILGFIDVAFVILAGKLVFQVPIKGSLFLLFALSGIYLFTTLGLGLFISTMCRTEEQAMIVVFFAILIMTMLSGIIFPIANMPPAIQYATYLMPLRYFATIVRGIFLKGVGLEVLWQDALILFTLGLLILSVSIVRLRKKVL